MRQSNKIIVIICLLLGVFRAGAQQTTRIVRGQVLSGGQPVPNANIQIDEQVLHCNQMYIEYV